MVEKIIVGRNVDDLMKYGSQGTLFIGKNIVGEGEEAHLTNPVQIDAARPHIILVTGKRGSGKSYTGAVFAEEIAALPREIRENLSVLMIDTMGIYWSSKSPNERDKEELKRWGMAPQGLETNFFVPKGYAQEYEKAGVKFDGALILPAGELTSEDWITTFGFSLIDPHGILIERAIKKVKEKHGSSYSIKEIIPEVEKDEKSPQEVKDALVNRFMAAQDWGIFERKGTPIKELIRPGTVSILDVSHYTQISEGWSVRGMLLGLLSRKIFRERLMARKEEEVAKMTGEKRRGVPMVWIIMDEAHQFLPSRGVTAATEPLLTLVKQGREPGISLLFITQRPNKLHEDVLAQSDIVISHRLTAQADIQALRSVMQTYMLEDIEEYISSLPKKNGAAIVLDDNSERIYMVQVRPRLSWHAGGSPSAIKEKGLFE